jgi:thiamine-phosphate pyrophosphorylase
MGFGDGDQAHTVGAPAIGARRITDGLFDLGKILCNVDLHYRQPAGRVFGNSFGQQGMNLSDYARRLNFNGGDDRLPPAILMTDAARLADPRQAAGALPPGSAILYRNYGSAARAGEARRIKSLCVQRRLLLIIAEDPRLAGAIGADGLHLTERTARSEGVARAWKMRPGTLLTAAAHSPRALRAAAGLGADAALLSPIFATQSHPGAAAIGVQRFVRWSRSSPLPVYALGGVNFANAARLLQSGAAGIAGIGGWMDMEPRKP